MKDKNRLGEIIRFVLAGGGCFALELAILIALRDGCRMNTLVATPIAFIVSLLVNYLLCTHWVFKGANKQGRAEKAAFLITSLLGLAINELVMFALGRVFDEDHILFNIFSFSVSMVMIHKTIATGIVTVWNYVTKRAILKKGIHPVKP